MPTLFLFGENLCKKFEAESHTDRHESNLKMFFKIGLMNSLFKLHFFIEFDVVPCLHE